nr:MAG TPA: hypothetical protein [Crassvirales sp.]
MYMESYLKLQGLKRLDIQVMEKDRIICKNLLKEIFLELNEYGNNLSMQELPQNKQQLY